MMQERTGWGAQMAQWLPVAILIVAVLVVFSQSLNYPLMSSWDDPDHVTYNSHLAATWDNIWHWCRNPIVGIYMPVTMFSYMLDHAIWGFDPFGYRLQSLFWHLVAVLAFFGCCRKLGLRTGVALVISLFFAIHPQRVESVAWVSERKDVLCAGLYFLCLYLYIRKMDTERFNWAAWTVFVLALLSKPMAVSLPFVIICLEFYRRRDFNWRYYLRVIWPWLVATLLVMIVTMELQVLAKHRTVDLGRLITVAGYNVFWYVDMTLFPRELGPMYPKVTFTAASVATMCVFYLALLLGGVFAWRRGWRNGMIFCCLPLAVAFCMALGPVVSMIHAGYIDHADRYSYIPSTFLWFGLGWGWQLFCRHFRVRADKYRRMLTLLLVLYGLYLGGYSWYYVQSWQNYYDMIRITCMREYPNDVALAELGLAELERKNYEEVFAVADRFDRNIRPWMTAEDRQGQHVYANFFRAEALFNRGYMDEAEKLLLELAKTSGPESFYKVGYYRQLAINLYMIRMAHRDQQGALKYLNILLKDYDRPNGRKDFKFYFYSGMKAVMEKRDHDAERFFENALRMEPGDQAVRENLRNIRERKTK